VRTHVTFRHPAPLVLVSEDDGILSIDGADWFVSLLKRIDDLTIDAELIQEDWGVVVKVARSGKTFWIGLSFWPEGDQAWLAHLHHGSFKLLQRLLPAGDRELRRLLSDLHVVLAAAPSISEVRWYQEDALMRSPLDGAATPNEA
jgi:hypothetical protein